MLTDGGVSLRWYVQNQEIFPDSLGLMGVVLFAVIVQSVKYYNYSCVLTVTCSSQTHLEIIRNFLHLLMEMGSSGLLSHGLNPFWINI